MSTISLALDSGKHSTKGLCRINNEWLKMKIRTKGQEIENMGVEIARDSYAVEFHGKQYLLGQMVSEQKGNTDLSKHSLLHLLSIYTMITLFLDKLAQERFGIPIINLSINVPLNIYKNSLLKNEYSEFVWNGHKPISIKVNGKQYLFSIDQLLLLPEATGKIYANINEYRQKRVLVVDIGGLNVNFAIYDRLIPQLDSLFSNNHGTNLLRSRIRETLSSHYGITISIDDSEQILHDGFLSVNGHPMEESKGIILRLIDDHLTEMINDAKSHGLSLNNTQLLFCGGGGILCKDAIMKTYPYADIDQEGEYSNVMSYWRIMEAKGLVKS